MSTSKPLKNNVSNTHKKFYDPPMYVSSALHGHFFDLLWPLWSFKSAYVHHYLCLTGPMWGNVFKLSTSEVLLRWSIVHLRHISRHCEPFKFGRNGCQIPTFHVFPGVDLFGEMSAFVSKKVELNRVKSCNSQEKYSPSLKGFAA